MINKTEKVAPKSPLKILLLENEPKSNLNEQINASDLKVEILVAHDKYDFLTHLIRFLPEIILLKDEVAGFSVRDAFYLVRETYPMVPTYGIMSGRPADSDEPGPGTPSDIRWVAASEVLEQLAKTQQTKAPVSDGQVQLARMRVVRQIKSNILGLKAIREFLVSNDMDCTDWAGNVAEEIDHSIEYLTKLHDNLKVEIQAERSK